MGTPGSARARWCTAAEPVYDARMFDRLAAIAAMGVLPFALLACKQDAETKPGAAAARPTPTAAAPSGGGETPIVGTAAPVPSGAVPTGPEGAAPAGAPVPVEAGGEGMPAAPEDPSAPDKMISGTVKFGASLAPDAQPGGILVVAARAYDGAAPGPVVAMQRHAGAKLPFEFQITSKDVMAGKKLSGKYLVEAWFEPVDPGKDDGQRMGGMVAQVEAGSGDVQISIMGAPPVPSGDPGAVAGDPSVAAGPPSDTPSGPPGAGGPPSDAPPTPGEPARDGPAGP